MAKIQTRIRMGVLNFRPGEPAMSLADRCIFYVMYKKHWWSRWRYVMEGGRLLACGKAAVFHTHEEAVEVSANIELYI